MKSNIILVDFENVQPKDLAELQGRPFMTKIFCGANQSKIPFDLAAELQPLGPNAEYIRIQGTGRNALDFHIAYYIGCLSAEVPASTFYIVSKDTGFDPLIKHLHDRHITCHRVASLKEITCLPGPASGVSQDRIQKTGERLLNRKDGRPRTLRTLRAFIKAQLNAHGTEAAVDQVIARLKQAGVSILSDGKVNYPLAE